MDLGSAIAQFVAIAGGLSVLASVVTSWATRRKIAKEAGKTDAEASAIYVKAATDLMAPLQAENKRLSEKVDELTVRVEAQSGKIAELTQTNGILVLEVRDLTTRLSRYENTGA